MANGYTEVFAWGGDHFGQLGLASKQTGKTYCVPRFCSFNVFIKQVACGEEHAAFIAQNGCVYTMGSNSEGRLGIGNRAIRQSASPCLVETLSTRAAEYVACGWGHTAVVSQGLLFAWGVGEYGALGVGSVETQWLPVQVALSAELTPLAVSCGSRHTGALVYDDRTRRKTLVMMGAGEAGQLGTGHRDKELLPVRVPFPSEEIKQVSCGIFHTGFVTVSGRVYMMGGNSFGQLGVGTKKSSSQPLRVSALDNVPVVKVACGHHSAAVSEYGELYLWGSGVFGEFLTPQLMTEITGRVTEVDVGGSFGAAIDSQSCLWTWGSNTNGELGLGDYDQRLSPSLVSTLQGKRVRAIACGGAFCLSLGLDIQGQALSSRSTNTQRTSSYHFHSSASPIRPHTPLAFPQDRRTDYLRTREPPRPPEAREVERVRKEETDFTEERRQNDLKVSEVSRVKDTTHLFESELAAKDREIATLKASNDRLIRDKAAVEGQMRADSTEASVLHHKVEDLNSTFEHMVLESRQKDEELASLRDANTRIMQERDRFEAIARDKETAFARSVADRTAYSRKETEDVIRRKDGEIASMMAEIRNLEAELSGKERESAADHYRIDLLSGDKAKTEGDLAVTKAEVQRLLVEAGEKDRRAADLRREMDLRDSELDRITSELESVKRSRGELETVAGLNEGLRREVGEMKGTVEAREVTIAGLRRELESAGQARSLLTSDFSKTINDLEACKLQNGDLRSRLSDKDSDLQRLTLSLDSLQRENSTLQMQVSRLESDLQSISAFKDKLSLNLEQQTKALAHTKLQAEESTRRLEAETKIRIEDYEEKLARLRANSDTKVEELWRELRQGKEVESELRTVVSGLEGGKQHLGDLLQTQVSKAESLQREWEQVRYSLKGKEDQVAKVTMDLESAGRREKALLASKEELLMELERCRSQASSSSQRITQLETRSREDDETIAALEADNSQLQAAVSELKYEFEKLCQQHNDTLREMTHQQETNEDLHDMYERTKGECQRLEKEVSELEKKNKEIFKNFEMELTHVTRGFRERSMSTLATPSPMRPLSSNPPESANRSSASALSHARKDISPSVHRDTSPPGRRDRSPPGRRDISPPGRRLEESISPKASVSPKRTASPKDLLSFRDLAGASPEPASLPMQATKATGVDNIRSRLTALQSSKADLASKMQELQRKLQEDPPLPPAEDPPLV